MQSNQKKVMDISTAMFCLVYDRLRLAFYLFIYLFIYKFMELFICFIYWCLAAMAHRGGSYVQTQFFLYTNIYFYLHCKFFLKKVI